MSSKTAYFHLPGLFEFYELYKVFLPIFREHREYFYDWCDIGSIYGSPMDCIWSGGRVEVGEAETWKVLNLMQEYGISARLTFSNSLLKEEHLSDKICNDICSLFAQNKSEKTNQTRINIQNTSMESCGTQNQKIINSYVSNGVIVHSDLLLNYLKKNYPELYFVSSTTKVITDFQEFLKELNREDFRYVVPDFRLNKEFDKLKTLSEKQKDKVEFLCNECCWFGCKDRKVCYEAVSHKNLGEDFEHNCKAPNSSSGYQFSKAMKNQGFISVDDIKNVYLPMEFTNFKIEGRGLGSALILEFLLYYMTKPEYQINVREKIYLDNMLDLF
ncbi:hypothetical protein [Eubacterium sp. Marseille-QA0814]|uniref:hypothetical protein n=1 Tax=Eubacterium sp. Marseille-QA0814 TaxID=3378778 RepID=UPI003D0CE8B4